MFDFSITLTFPVGGILTFPEFNIVPVPNANIEENPFIAGSTGGVSVTLGGTVSDAGQPKEY